MQLAGACRTQNSKRGDGDHIGHVELVVPEETFEKLSQEDVRGFPSVDGELASTSGSFNRVSKGAASLPFRCGRLL